MSYKIKCDFKEKLIEIDIARFIGSFTPLLGTAYYLETPNEQLTGADLLTDDTNGILVYIQAKVSQGLKTITSFDSSARKNRSKLEDIREFRDNILLDINDEYFLYFQLRKKASKADDFQHNILMNYANNGFSHAFYVAPLIIEKKEYEKQFLEFSNSLKNPFYFHNYELKEKNWTSYYGFIPFLRNHISIIPHEKIDTHEHYYAYSKHGIDITWHSPEYVDNKPSRLSDKMIKIMQDYLTSDKKETIRTLADKLLEMPIMKEYKLQLKDNKPIDIITRHGKILEEKFEIKQLLFTENIKY